MMPSKATTPTSTRTSTRTSTGTTDQDADQLPAVNLVVLRGVASVPAQHRTLRSGGRLATLSVRVPGPPAHATDGRGRQHATSVPVAIWDPPAWLDAVDVDDPLVVVGHLQRRFYRSEGGTGARVEVVATLIGRGTDRRRVDAAERRALAELEGLE
jgi:hypothetical protein